MAEATVGRRDVLRYRFHRQELHRQPESATGPTDVALLWRMLGRPGAVVADGEILGTWRPRASGPRHRPDGTVGIAQGVGPGSARRHAVGSRPAVQPTRWGRQTAPQGAAPLDPAPQRTGRPSRSPMAPGRAVLMGLEGRMQDRERKGFRPGTPTHTEFCIMAW